MFVVVKKYKRQWLAISPPFKHINQAYRFLLQAWESSASALAIFSETNGVMLAASTPSFKLTDPTYKGYIEFYERGK